MSRDIKELRERINSGAAYTEIEDMEHDRLVAYAIELTEMFCDVAEGKIAAAEGKLN